MAGASAATPPPASSSPNGARRSPDASWTLKSRIATLGDKKRGSFWHLCPDFAIEVRSATDRLAPIRTKLSEYCTQGTQLAWLIDPTNQTIEIYRPGTEPELLTGLTQIEGEGPVSGFVLDLTQVWDPLAD